MNNSTKFKEGNKAAEVHGGAAAKRALTTGKEFTGLAVDAEKQIKKDYAQLGPRDLLERDCLRIHTAAELYWQAILGAIEENDMPKFETYVRSFGWLATAGARLLVQLSTFENKGESELNKVLDAYSSQKPSESPQEGQGGAE